LIEGNKFFYEKIKEYFPDKKIIPVLGNHETHPVNFYDLGNEDNFTNKHILKYF